MKALLTIVKTLLTVTVAGAVVIASFYFAYLLLFLLVMLVVGILAYAYFNRAEVINWFDIED
ncbi:MAG: hypothetical protein OEX07_01685 [Gammaproteobacteria bacterium]|nr:hypothetical protein [Gammaproteobacteria bacterium]